MLVGGTSEFDRNGILKIAVNKNWVLNFLKVVFGHGSCFAWTVYAAIVSCLVGAAFYDCIILPAERTRCTNHELLLVYKHRKKNQK